MDEDRAAAVLPQLRTLVSVTHVVSPRVVLVTNGERDLTSVLSSTPGVRRVYTEDVTAEELESDESFRALSRKEALVARAWLLRQQQHEKHRPGEGIAWDAEGFDPP